jgi:hypothetical protein
MEESYLDLMMSLPHWGFELTLEALTGLLVYPLIRWGHKRLNDRLHRELDAEHGVTHGTPAATPTGPLRRPATRSLRPASATSPCSVRGLTYG